MNFIGTRVDVDVRDTLSVKKVLTSDDHEYVGDLKRRLSLFEQLKHTPYFRLISDLVDPMIQHLESQLTKPRGAFPDTPTDVLREQQAEWRGMLHVWKRLRDEPLELSNAVSLLEAKIKKGGADGKNGVNVDRFV
jgi:hypothetical protein